MHVLLNTNAILVHKALFITPVTMNNMRLRMALRCSTKRFIVLRQVPHMNVGRMLGILVFDIFAPRALRMRPTDDGAIERQNGGDANADKGDS